MAAFFGDHEVCDNGMQIRKKWNMGPKKAGGWVNYEVLGIWGSEDWEVGTVVGRCGQSGEIPRPAFRSCPRPRSTNLGPYDFENLGF